MRSPTDLRGILYLVCAQIMVAINIVVSKSLIETIPVIMMMNIRFGLAAVILFPLHWFTHDRDTPCRQHFANLTRKDWSFLSAQALCAGVLFNSLMLTGLRYTDANVAGIITSALPAMIALLSWLILKEMISAKKCLCVLLATTGLFITAYDKMTNVGGHHSFLGDAIILTSLLPEAGYYVLTKRHKTPLPVFLTSSLLNAINAILLLPLSFALHGHPATLSIQHGLILIILGISAGLFYVFWMLGCQRVDSVMGSLSTAIMPVATVFFAWLLLHEALTLYQFFGLSLVIISIIMYARH